MPIKDFALDLAEKLWHRAPTPLRHQIIRSTQTKFLIGTLGIITNPQAEILLLEHRFRGLYPWGLPGGFLQRNETPAQGLRRELSEETGLDITVNTGIYDIFFDSKARYATLILIGETTQTELNLGPEIKSGAFFEPSQILPETRPTDLELLRNWLSPNLS